LKALIASCNQSYWSYESTVGLIRLNDSVLGVAKSFLIMSMNDCDGQVLLFTINMSAYVEVKIW